MLRSLGLGLMVMACVLLASVSSAQQRLSGFAGAVKDSMGNPVAGVTVEAASRVLIERVRSVVTGSRSAPAGAPSQANGRNLTLPNGKRLSLGSSGTGAPYELTPENQRK